MKKWIALLLVLVTVLSLAACSKKPAGNDEQTPTEEKIQGDPVEYTMEYWAKKYPDKNICPFSIVENGVGKNYFLIMEMGCTMEEWVNSPFNWNGWHKVGDDIVNADETLKMTADWLGTDPASGFSSYCDVTTEPFTPAA